MVAVCICIHLDFSVCDIAVDASLTFILVYLISPAAGASKDRMDALPANSFAFLSFNVGERDAGFLWRSAVVLPVAFCLVSVVGTSASLSFVRHGCVMRKKDGRRKVDKPLPITFVNSAAWAVFVFLSANPRYHALAGLECLFARLCRQGGLVRHADGRGTLSEATASDAGKVLGIGEEAK